MNENDSATAALTQSRAVCEGRLFKHIHISKLKYALLLHLNFHCAII